MSKEKDNNLFEFEFNSFFKDYEFYGSDIFDIPEMSTENDYANNLTRSGVKLYFEMSDDMSYCEEVFTGKKFINMSEEEFVKKFYNEETGLYMLVPTNYKDYPVNLKNIASYLFDRKYLKRVSKFFDMYKSINEYDQHLLGSMNLLSLKRKTVEK
jgi:hypothetical protein